MKSISHHSVPSRVYVSRKLPSKAELGLNPRHPDKGRLDCWANACLSVNALETVFMSHCSHIHLPHTDPLPGWVEPMLANFVCPFPKDNCDTLEQMLVISKQDPNASQAPAGTRSQKPHSLVDTVVLSASVSSAGGLGRQKEPWACAMERGGWPLGGLPERGLCVPGGSPGHAAGRRVSLEFLVYTQSSAASCFPVWLLSQGPAGQQE